MTETEHVQRITGKAYRSVFNPLFKVCGKSS